MELQTHDTLKNLTHNTEHLTLSQTDYLAYGEELTEPLQDNNGTILNKIGFTGHEHDYGTGFINMQARLQNPETGKFLSVDPGYDYDQNDPMSFNLYAYVRCNPIGRTDPTGMNEEDEKKKKLTNAEKARLQYWKNGGKGGTITIENKTKDSISTITFDGSLSNYSVEFDFKTESKFEIMKQNAEEEAMLYRENRYNMIEDTLDKIGTEIDLCLTAGFLKKGSNPWMKKFLKFSTWLGNAEIIAAGEKYFNNPIEKNKMNFIFKCRNKGISGFFNKLNPFKKSGKDLYEVVVNLFNDITEMIDEETN